MARQDEESVHDPDAITPLPNLIPRPNDKPTRRQWEFRTGKKPRTDLTNKVMVIPTGNTDADFSDRQHEMLHAAFSPQIMGNKPNLLCLEDARIQILAGQHGIELQDSDKIPSETAVIHVMLGDKSSALQFAIANIGNPRENEILDLLEQFGQDKIVEVTRKIKQELTDDPSFETAFRLTELVEMTEQQLMREGDGEEEKEKDPDSCSGSGEMLVSADGNFSGEEADENSVGDCAVSGSPVQETPEDGNKEKTPPKPSNAAHMTSEELKKKVDEALRNPDVKTPEAKQVLKDLKKKIETVKKPPTPRPPPIVRVVERESAEATPGAKGTTREGECPKNVFPVEREYLYPPSLREWKYGRGEEWADIKFSYPALVVPCLGKGRGPKAVDYGVVPRNIHRLTIDQKVFNYPRGKKRGTILCDMSGSMSLRDDQIIAMLEKAPAAVIAGYWGNGSTGTLRILAANGFRTERIHAEGYGNCIDGPAVEWLARQKVPRIYVTDECYTGRNESSISRNGPAATTLRTTVERARIKIVRLPKDAIKCL